MRRFWIYGVLLHFTIFCCKVSFLRFTLLCREISFGTIYALLRGENFSQNCARGEKMTNMRYATVVPLWAQVEKANVICRGIYVIKTLADLRQCIVDNLDNVLMPAHRHGGGLVNTNCVAAAKYTLVCPATHSWKINFCTWLCTWLY